MAIRITGPSIVGASKGVRRKMSHQPRIHFRRRRPGRAGAPREGARKRAASCNQPAGGLTTHATPPAAVETDDGGRVSPLRDAAESGQDQTPDTPRMTATREIRRPIPE